MVKKNKCLEFDYSSNELSIYNKGKEEIIIWRSIEGNLEIQVKNEFKIEIKEKKNLSIKEVK